MDKKTRGKTRAGRLDRLDEVLSGLLVEQGWFASRQPSPVLVELGFGASSVTARSWFSRVLAHAPDAHCIGVEIDEDRVIQARRAGEMQGVTWRQGGFDFTLPEHDEVDMVRALNVLRQYDARVAPAAHARMGRHLASGGLLVVGSCDAHGQRCVVHVQRLVDSKLVREGLLCVVDPQRPFAPRMLRDWLPQDLRRGVHATHPVFASFLDVWMEEFLTTGDARGARRFEQSARQLAARLDSVYAPAWMTELGAVYWRPEGGVPARHVHLE